MEETLPPEIEVRDSDGVIRYTLPRRSLGLFGAVPLIVGAGLLGTEITAGQNQPRLEGLFFAVFVIAFPVFGSVALLVGLDGVLGRALVELDAERLKASSRVLGLGWWRSHPVRPRLGVEARRILVEGGDPRDPMGDLVAVAGPRRRRLAANYRLSLLRPLAADINRRLGGSATPTR